MPTASNRLQTKMKTKIVSARGTTRVPSGPIWSATCRWMVWTAISQRSWNLPGTPLEALARRRTPRSTTIRPAMSVAHTMSTLTVSPRTFACGWTPTTMLVASSGRIGRPVITSLHLRSRVDHRLSVDVDHVTAGQAPGLEDGPGHVHNQEHLEDGQPGENAETDLRRDDEEAEGEHGYERHPGDGVHGDRPPGPPVGPSRRPGHRAAHHAEVQGAHGEADRRPEPDEHVPQGHRGDQGGDPEDERARDRPAGDVGHVGQGEVGEHRYRSPPRLLRDSAGR